MNYPCVAYLVTNVVNGKQYVGITKDTVSRRWSGHCASAIRGRKHGVLPAAIRKYGRWSFSIRVLFVAPNRKYLEAMEPGLIAAYNTFVPNGYNATRGGEGAVGIIITEQQRAARRIMQKEIGSRPEIKFHRSARAKKMNSDPEWRSNRVAKVREKWSDPNWRASYMEKHAAAMRSKPLRQLRSDLMKARRSDPTYLFRHHLKILAAACLKRAIKKASGETPASVVGAFLGFGA